VCAEKKTAVEVRLMDGKTAHDGRVEVRTNNGQWSTVCNKYWDLRDVYVVCHMLNYSKAVSAGTANVKGSGPIFPKWVDCYGHETSIAQCGQGSASCDHSQDVAVVCGNSLTPGKTRYTVSYKTYRKTSIEKKNKCICQKKTKSNENICFIIHQCLFSEEKAISVRLVGTNVSHVGQVEIHYNGTWGAVCSYDYNEWDIQDAHVICRMLGYKATDGRIQYIKGDRKTRILMDGVGCSGKEMSIAECAHRGWWDVGSYCSYVSLAGVVCQVDEGKKVKNTILSLILSKLTN